MSVEAEGILVYVYIEVLMCLRTVRLMYVSMDLFVSIFIFKGRCVYII